MLNTGKKGKEISFEKGVIIIEQGTSPDFVYWLEEGRLEVFLKEPNNGIRVLGQVFNQEFFGELSAITGASAANSVRTLTKCKLYQFEITEFFELLDEEPELNKHLLHTMAERSKGCIRRWLLPNSFGYDHGVQALISAN